MWQCLMCFVTFDFCELAFLKLLPANLPWVRQDPQRLVFGIVVAISFTHYGTIRCVVKEAVQTAVKTAVKNTNCSETAVRTASVTPP